MPEKGDIQQWFVSESVTNRSGPKSGVSNRALECLWDYNTWQDRGESWHRGRKSRLQLWLHLSTRFHLLRSAVSQSSPLQRFIGTVNKDGGRRAWTTRRESGH
jgi:hypothetical protein